MAKTGALMKRADESSGEEGTSVAPPERKVTPLSMATLRAIGYGDHQLCTVIAPTGATPDDLAHQDFWSVASEKLRAFDVVQVIADDWWGEVLVRRSEHRVAFDVVVLRVVPLPAIEVGGRSLLPPDHEIVYVPARSVFEAWRTKPDPVKFGEARSWNEARDLIISHASLRDPAPNAKR